MQCTWIGELKTSCAGFKKASPKAVSTRKHSIWKLRKWKEVTWEEETLLENTLKTPLVFISVLLTIILHFLVAWHAVMANLLQDSGSRKDWRAQHVLAFHSEWKVKTQTVLQAFAPRIRKSCSFVPLYLLRNRQQPYFRWCMMEGSISLQSKSFSVVSFVSFLAAIGSFAQCMWDACCRQFTHIRGKKGVGSVF